MSIPKTQFNHDFALLRSFDNQQQGLGLPISLGDLLDDNETNMMRLPWNFLKFYFSLWEIEKNVNVPHHRLALLNVYLEATTAFLNR